MTGRTTKYEIAPFLAPLEQAVFRICRLGATYSDIRQFSGRREIVLELG
jgi:hypothetical protein